MLSLKTCEILNRASSLQSLNGDRYAAMPLPIALRRPTYRAASSWRGLYGGVLAGSMASPKLCSLNDKLGHVNPLVARIS